MKRYIGKVGKLIRNPGKAKYIPSFLHQEFVIWRGLTTTKLDDLKCRFVVNSLSEYSRINGFKNEEDVIREIIDELEPGDIFYDIGANIGTHSCFAGKTDAKVYGFEPFPKNAESLRKNFELNSVDGEVFEVALMNEDSEMKLSEESGEAGEGKVSISEEGNIKTEVHRGDNFLKEKALEKPNVMKIDIEGGEFEALKGLNRTLESKELRKVFIEIHPKRIEEFGGSLEELRELVRQKGFNIEKISDRNKETHIKAIKKD